jgi:hypothetical protein
VSLEELDLETLVHAARAEVIAEDADPPLGHLVELHRRGTRDVFDRACQLCTSPDAGDRLLGVWILRELGGSPPRFAAEAVPWLLGMLAQETSPSLLARIVDAIGYQHVSGELRPRLVPTQTVLDAILALASHDDAGVRLHVAASLDSLVDLHSPQPEAIKTLLALAADVDADTRWYALAALTDDLHLGDRDDVRLVLEQRATDLDPKVRASARRVLDGGDWLDD